MDEAKWLTWTNPDSMLEFLRGKISDRKLRLFAVGCCRQHWDRITVEAIKRLIDLAERYADFPATEGEWLKAFHSVRGSYCTKHVAWPNAWEAAVGISRCWFRVLGTGKSRHTQVRHQAEGKGQGALLRDLVGNPFQPQFVVAEWLTWNEQTVPHIAQAIYVDKAFDRLPILADALEDAGCTDTEILLHLRGPGPHVRGCWPVDLILDKK